MKFSNLLFKSERLDATKLSVSELAQKACLFNQDASGLFSQLTLGLKLLKQLENLISQKMESIGSSEIELALLQEERIWRESGRLELYGEELFRLKARGDKKLVLGATAEELVTNNVKDKYLGKRDINVSVYQIGKKFRDEIRARAGLIRSKEFVMKDAYSFSSSEAGAIEAYTKMRKAYEEIFQELGLDYLIEGADSGQMGGGMSEEFLVKSEFGDERGLLEIAHIFNLGDKYSKTLGFHDADKKAVQMGCYGIGVSRLMMAMLEAQKDKYGFYGTKAFNTFEVVISSINYEGGGEVKEISDRLYEALKANSVRVLLDDRSVKAGVKFFDSEAICAVKRVIVSQDALERGTFEVLDRKTMEKQFLNLEELKNLRV